MFWKVSETLFPEEKVLRLTDSIFNKKNFIRFFFHITTEHSHVFIYFILVTFFFIFIEVYSLSLKVW